MKIVAMALGIAALMFLGAAAGVAHVGFIYGVPDLVHEAAIFYLILGLACSVVCLGIALIISNR